MSRKSAHHDRSVLKDLTIVDLFAEHVLARPSAAAVTSGHITVSYAELDQWSDRIAAWLIEHDVGPEDIVAVEMERGHHLIAALIGILKTGAAYLALELGTPRARRDRLVADAGALALISSREEPSRKGLPSLRLPDDVERLPRERLTATRRAHPDWLAYICYTSGSTGHPKGVGVPHRGVVRLVAGDYADFDASQTFLLLSPVSFDASTFEIWAPLLIGGRVVIHPAGPVIADELAAVLREEKITTLFLTTALFHRMVDHDLEAFANLRQLLTGGEALNPAHFNRFIDRFPEIRLIAAYGPTENTTFTTCGTVARTVRTAWVPLGQPIAGTTVRVLDDRLVPVEPGSRGEMYVSGAGLSRAYVGQPAATAINFLPDPFGDPGSRMYRTGDIVRQAPGGDLEFVGRVDRQAKIRGVRVEPAEVEREISAVPGVKEVVVAAHGDRLDEKRLTAYVVPTPGEDDPEEFVARVRRRLLDSLPAAMIPAAFVTMNELPLTPNGKVDQAALPVPERTERRADADFVAPRSLTEQLLGDLWAESLKLDSVGVQDDFFELGGNSLLAIDLIRRAEMVFDVELPVRALFDHPTVEEFASAVDKLAGHAGART